MSNTNQPDANQSSKPSRSSKSIAGIVGLVLVAILSLGFAGYSALNPQMITVTQQNFITNTQSITNTQTQTVVNTKTVTSATTITSTTSVVSANGFGYNLYYPYYPYPSYENCGAYCPPPSSSYLNNYNTCNLNGATGPNSTVQCYGYLYQAPNGCEELVVPISNPYYWESPVYQYYGLRNLPSNAPSNGTWVTVTGQLHQGSNTTPSGAACPSNYLSVSSMSQ